MRILSLSMIALASCAVAFGQLPNAGIYPPVGIPCVGTPGATSGALNQICLASGTPYVCLGTVTGGKCAVAGDWAIPPASGAPPTGAAGGVFVLGSTYPNPAALTTTAVSTATTFVDIGSVNAIAFTDTALNSYSANLTFTIIPAHTNTGAATITVTGSGGALATLPLQRNGSALTGGEYLIGQPFPVVCGVSACQIAAFGKLNLLVLPVATKTASYGAQNMDYLILADPTSAAVTITAPLAPVLGQIFVVKMKAYSATHDVVVSGGSALIDGQTSCTVTYMQSLTFMWDGTAWWII